jgi:hypothetical protein
MTMSKGASTLSLTRDTGDGKAECSEGWDKMRRGNLTIAVLFVTSHGFCPGFLFTQELEQEGRQSGKSKEQTALCCLVDVSRARRFFYPPSP